VPDLGGGPMTRIGQSGSVSDTLRQRWLGFGTSRPSRGTSLASPRQSWARLMVGEGSPRRCATTMPS
jgi:hypothetical protein